MDTKLSKDALIETIAAAGILSLVLFGVALGLSETKRLGIVRGLQWERIIEVEEFRTVHYNSSTRKPPDTAFNVETEVDFWVTTETYTDSNGDTQTRTVFHEETYYSYDNNEWAHKQDVAVGDLDKIPFWPVVNLEIGPLGHLDRLGKRHEEYRLHVELVGSDPEYKDVEFDDLILPFEKWDLFDNGTLAIVKYNGFGMFTDIDVARVELE